MAVPGVYNLGVGGAVCAIGLAVTLGSISASGGSFGVVAYGAVLVGGLQAIVGLFQFLAFKMKSPEKQAIHYAQIEVRALVRSMIAMAAANGNVSDQESEMISHVTRRFTGMSLTASQVKEIAGPMMKRDYSLHDDLKSTQSQIGDATKELILKCCYLVVAVDGHVDDKEAAQLVALANTLNVGQNRLHGLIATLNSPKATAARAGH